ncbi:DENN domain-containing protein 4C-like isoform X1 [Limulus polyphemus]|uniref:DENN domain-containing protein 4C-like isoform X1 n=1 Tax=Limulus polyphemus TaxID=6850 RepID=A0ABM1T9B6_LIMPO|nr:DENN domain-containing protein 4C-like isoform X1 [Limulus polyphemus]
MEDKRVADYFVVAGLPDNPEPLEEFSQDGVTLKTSHTLAPVTDITVIIRSQGEIVPQNFTCIETTPLGFPADLNHGSLRSPSIYLCYRRGRDKPPLVDIGVLYETKERVMADSQVVHTTPYGRSANVNNSGSRTFLTFRRAATNAPCNQLVVTDICIILVNKGETPPRAFCIINKTLNKGMVGSDVYICYKKSMNRPDLLCFKPGILSRYPLDDYQNFRLPESVPLFCLPMGATVECWSRNAQLPRPVFSTFVLTSDTAEKVYGAAVTFYEKYKDEKLSSASKAQLGYMTDDDCKKKSLHVNKAICILSRWPFFDTFEKFLLQLHQISIMGPHRLPLERYISHFMMDVPFPSAQRPRILIQLGDNTISLAQPEDSPLLLSGASFIQLLRNLGADNCLNVLLFVLTEQKILFHSLRPDVLTSVAEAVVTLIFPFHWQCPYIPLCPLGLSDVLNAPLPYIVGVDSRYFDLCDPPHDVACVDLDTNNIFLPEEKKGLNTKLLPKRPARVLRNTLQVLYDRMRKMSWSHKAAANLQGSSSYKTTPLDHDFKIKKIEHQLELEIQEAFLRFMAAILKGFRSYLLPIPCAPTVGATDPSSLFDGQGFLKSRDKTHHRFYNLMTKTQMFIRFIEERSFVSDKNVSLAFFDECTDRVDLAGELSDQQRLLESDEHQQSDRTVFIASPEPVGLPNGTEFSYQEFGTLNPQLFHTHPVKSFFRVGNTLGVQPSSPMARRTKQEIRTASRIAKKQAENPVLWAKCLVSNCYSLWFIHLPAYTKCSQAIKAKTLRTAYDVLVRMQSIRLQPADETCYRVLMLLCGLYRQPILAVRVLSEMKRNGVQPNAITYGYYNKAVLESKWPASETNAALMWNKLRNVIVGVAQFRQGSKAKVRRSLSLGSDFDYDWLSRASSENSNTEEVVEGKSNQIELTSDLGQADKCSSVGGLSDGGYSSMNQEEVQKAGSTQMLAPTCDVEEKNRTSDLLKSNLRRKQGYQEMQSLGALKFECLDFSASDAFRNRVGSIVRSSASSLSSHSRMMDISVDSFAGLLITSHLLLVNSPSHEDLLWQQNGEQGQQKYQSAGRHLRKASQTYRLKHYSCPLTQSLSKADSSQTFLHLSSFGNDTQIIRKIKNGHVSLKDLKSTENHKEHSLLPVTENCVNSSVEKTITSSRNLKLSSCEEESDTELAIEFNEEPVKMKPHSKSDIAFKRQAQTCEGDMSTSRKLNSHPENSSYKRNSCNSDDIILQGAEEHGTVKEAWLNWDYFKTSSIPRVASSLSSTLGFSSGKKNSKVTRSSTFHGPADRSSTNSLTDSASKNSNTLEMETVRIMLPHTPESKRNPKVVGTRTPGRPFAVSMSSFGLSKLTSKHADMFDSLKSAANSVATKFTELKQSWSASSTPTKNGFGSQPEPYALDRFTIYDDDHSSTTSECQRCSTDYLNHSSRNDNVLEDIFMEKSGDVGNCTSCGNGGLHLSGSASTYASQLFEIGSGHFDSVLDVAYPGNKIALEITMTSCSKCHKCLSLLYDEEIMEGWSAENSNLNTQCAFCKARVVPLLTVTIRDMRTDELSDSNLTPAHSTESIRSAPPTSQLLHHEGNLRRRTPTPKRGHSLERTMIHRSIDCGNAAWFVSEDSDSGSSKGGTPIVSPRHLSFSQDSRPKSAVYRPFSSRSLNIAKDLTDFEFSDSSTQSCRVSDKQKLSASQETPYPFATSVAEKTGTENSMTEKKLHIKEHFSVIHRNQPLQPQISSSATSSGGDLRKLGNVDAGIALEPFTVPYLSPLVLRKEIEYVLDHEGDDCLTKPEFVDQHPIIYWNLMWFCRRINVTTHIPGLCLQASSILKGRQVPDAWKSSDSHKVLVRCLWDNIKLHQEMGQPMYVMWNSEGNQSSLVRALVTDERKISRNIMCQILTRIQCNDLLSPINLLINERRKHCTARQSYHSIYRSLLFLCYVALGRENIDHTAFDREYLRAYEQLSSMQRALLVKADKPPSSRAFFCQRYFMELELKAV